MTNNPTISILNGTLKDPKIEANYQADSWESWVGQLNGTTLVAILLFETSTAIDFIRLEGSNLVTALALKWSAFLFVLFAIFLAHKTKKREAAQLSLLAATFCVGSGLVVSAYLSAEGWAAHALAGLLAILAYYLFVPNRIGYTAMAGLYTLGAYAYVSATVYNNPFADTLSLCFVYFAANLLGYITVVRVRTLHRKQFLIREDLKQKVQTIEETNHSLRQSQKNIEQLFDAAPLPLILVGVDSPVVLKANSAAREFFLKDEPQQASYQTTDFLPSNEIRKTLKAELESKGEIRNLIVESIHPEKGPIWGLVSALPVMFGKVKARIITFADITEQRKAEKKLRESEQELVTILQNMPDVFYRTDAQGYITHISPACEGVIGYTPEELIGTKMSDYYVEPEDREIILKKLVQAAGETVQVEAFMTRKDRKIVWISTKAFLRLDEDGKNLGVEGIARDLTDRKQLEDQLRSAVKEASEANKAKSKFLAAASHDLRQPLQALMLYSGVLNSKAQTHSEIKTAGEIENGLATMSELLDALLDISKLETGTIEPNIQTFPLNQICKKVTANFRPLAEGKGLDFRVVPSSYVTKSDPVLLENILSNLIANAIRYTDEGKILVGCRRKGDKLEVNVRDTGIGVSKAEREKIFDDFYQIGNVGRDRRQGLGLGLSIVDRTAKLLGHQVTWSSVEGEGSCFCVSIPWVKTSDLATTAITSGPAETPTPGGTVLLIEDDEDVLFALSSFLRESGFETIEAASQGEALDRLSKRPDLILADYRLANGLTGSDAIKAVHKKLEDSIPAIIVTGDTEPERLREITANNFRLIHKPVDHRHLLKVIAEEIKNKKSPSIP